MIRPYRSIFLNRITTSLPDINAERYAAASGPNGYRSSGASILSSRMRNGAPSRASRTVTVSPSATRTIFPRISAERTVRENTQSKSGSNFFTVHPPVAGSALPQKKGGAPPYTTADAYHCVTNNARKVHRLPKGKRYTIQLSVIRIKSKRLRVVFSAVF